MYLWKIVGVFSIPDESLKTHFDEIFVLTSDDAIELPNPHKSLEDAWGLGAFWRNIMTIEKVGQIPNAWPAGSCGWLNPMTEAMETNRKDFDGPVREGKIWINPPSESHESEVSGDEVDGLRVHDGTDQP